MADRYNTGRQFTFIGWAILNQQGVYVLLFLGFREVICFQFITPAQIPQRWGNMMSNLEDKIWITGKTRIFSEKRYRLYDVTSHLCLTYMSFLMIVASVFSKEIAAVLPHFDKITITLALFLFTMSMVIYGFKFSLIANQHRDCYLKLQALEQNFGQLLDPGAAYQEILTGYPNHSSWDYESLILERSLFGNGVLKSGGEEIKWTYWILLKKIFRLTVFLTLIIVPPMYVTYHFVLALYQ